MSTFNLLTFLLQRHNQLIYFIYCLFSVLGNMINFSETPKEISGLNCLTFKQKIGGKRYQIKITTAHNAYLFAAGVVCVWAESAKTFTMQFYISAVNYTYNQYCLLSSRPMPFMLMINTVRSFAYGLYLLLFIMITLIRPIITIIIRLLGLHHYRSYAIVNNNCE